MEQSFEQISGNGGKRAPGSLGSFRESLEALRDSCTTLESRCRTLNWALEDANRQLSASLKVRDTLASRLDGLLQCLPVGVVAIDLDGKITEFNTAAEVLTGLERSSVVGSRYGDVFGSGTVDSVGPLHTLATGHHFDGDEKDLTDAAGETIPVRFSTSTLRSQSGEVLGAIESFSDMRRAKLLQDEFVRVRELAAFGEAASEMARQVRNPLAGVAGFTALLADGLAADDEHLALVRKMEEGVTAVETTLQRLLESPRDDQGGRGASVDVCSAVDRAIHIIESASAGTPLNIRREFGAGRPWSNISEHRLRRVMLELLRNAADAMPAGGTITVAIDAERAGDSGLTGNVTIEVCDSGHGVTDEDARKAFSPFFSTRESRAGLGLTSARRIVTSCGGTIDLARGSIRGSVATVRLPLSGAEGDLR